MGNRGAKFAGLEVAPVTLQQSVDGIAREVKSPKRTRLSVLIFVSRLSMRPAKGITGCSEVTTVELLRGDEIPLRITG